MNTSLSVTAWMVGLSALLAMAAPSWAQDSGGSPSASMLNLQETTGDQAVPVPGQPAPIDMTADRLEYESDRNLLIGRGNVEVRHEGDFLTADYLEVYTDTQDVYARGNVYILQGTTEWEGEELRYNLETKQGDFGPFKVYQEPYYITAEESERVSENEIRLKNATLSTCEGPRPSFYINAKDAVIMDGNRIQSKNVTLHFLGAPFFFLPYFAKNLDETKWEFTPGYSSRQGAFLLTKYNYEINPNLDGAVRLDVRSKRGVAIGKDFIWEEGKRYRGEFNAYYANDNEPLQDDVDRLEFGDEVDADRWRFRLQHRQNVTPRDYFIADFSYISDPLILADFFDDEYKRNVQPENRATFTHRDDLFSAGAEISLRLNDFYGNLNRLPEVFLEAQRQQVYDTGLYYDSENRAGFYERVFEEDSDSEDYEAFRIDSRHRIFYPTRHFGWLNITPRTGYRGTWYSETRSFESVTNEVTSVDTNGIVSVTNVVTSVPIEGDAELRNIFEFGFETSFKAFKEIHDRPTVFGTGLRHVAEPFADYSYVPEPNLLPDELPQFDRVDRLNKRNQLRLGMRNKLQTKDGRKIRDLIDAEVFTDYFLDPDAGADNFSSLFYDIEMDPFEWIELDFDGSYSYENAELEEINSRARLRGIDDSFVGLEHRYRQDSRNLLAISTGLYPKDRWSPYVYWRYDLENSDWEEQIYSLKHRGDCLSWSVGVRDRDDDLTLWVQLWLTALPETALDLGR